MEKPRHSMTKPKPNLNNMFLLSQLYTGYKKKNSSTRRVSTPTSKKKKKTNNNKKLIISQQISKGENYIQTVPPSTSK